MINSAVLEFHETFKPELPYISQILKLASEQYSGNKHDISQHSGIPTGERKGKVVPHIRYAEFMGLIETSCEKGIYSLRLSSLGKEVFAQDPYLHEDLTCWLCHYCMTRRGAGAPQWSYLIHDAHPGLGEALSQERLFQMAVAWCDVMPAAMQKKVFSVVKSSYTESCFANLNFLDWDEYLTFHENAERFDLAFVYAYALFDSWERLAPEQREITDITLKDTMGLGKIFGFNEDEFGYVIDSLRDENLLVVNRQLYPMTIIRTASSQDIIPQLYSRLL